MFDRTLICLARGGHNWDYRGRDETFRCNTCGLWEDDPRAKRHFRARARLRRFSPVWIAFKRWGVTLTLGWTHLQLRAEASAFDRSYPHGPAIEVDVSLWRLKGHVWFGGFWWVDEDSERRSLCGATVNVVTWGLAARLCKVIGHRPGGEAYGWVSCKRCAETLQRPPDERRTAAA